MMWLADCSIAHSQVGVDAILHLCIVARKRPTPVLNLVSFLSFTHTLACFRSVIHCGLLLTSLM